MPQPHTLKIVEIFPSIQGEGLRQGEATIFIRLSGCNLKCPFCDTKYAWKRGRFLSISQVMARIHRIRRTFPARWVCLTGGEPLLQDVSELVLTLQKANLRVQVETNATISRPLSVDWLTLSPKPDDYYYSEEYREKADEVKIVVTKKLGLGEIQKLRKEFPPETPLLLQPQSNRAWSMSRGDALLRRALKAGLENIRLSCQLHKVFRLR